MSDSDSEDIQVIDRVLAGDTEAFSVIIKKYEGIIFRYAYSRVNNYDEAKDISQEIFMSTIESLTTFRRESKFITWLYSIMVNFCKNYKKKSARANIVSLHQKQGENEMELQLHDERENTESRVINADTLRIIKEEIQNLPDDYREILMLRDIEGITYNEIAEILDLNLSNVKVRIHRGREFLKNRLYARGLI